MLSEKRRELAATRTATTPSKTRVSPPAPPRRQGIGLKQAHKRGLGVELSRAQLEGVLSEAAAELARQTGWLMEAAGWGERGGRKGHKP